MKLRKGHIVVGVLGLLVGFAAILSLHAAQQVSASDEVIDAVHPLFSAGIQWTSKVEVSVPPLSAYNPTKKTIAGYQVTSLPTDSTEDIGAVIGPMRDYYDRVLLQKGWIMDTQFEADGPGGSLWGFTKGRDIVILSYTSTFMYQGEGQPKQCPCTIVFTIIGGSLQ